VKLRCYVESILRMHSRDCALCNPMESSGPDIRKRLEELNLRMQPRSVKNDDHEEGVREFDSKPEEVGANPPVSVAQQKKIV
jgi:hypothetical protein